uniref:Cap-specific mRNA (nucleoside-2'-O-)-methyltransferase 1 n=1 Tax=Meloidogyne incognita TaxID=6306 RepID=A0A914ME38_MELIC
MASDKEESESEMSEEAESSLSTKAVDSSQPSKAEQMMRIMGWQEGKGLGKREHGEVEPVSVRQKVGRTALGFDSKSSQELAEIDFDSVSEIKSVVETPTWLVCSEENRNLLLNNLNEEWIIVGKPKMRIDDEDRYCSQELLTQLVESKDFFDTVDRRVLDAARARANPYETIRAGFFQNRAAMKMANLDKIFGWRLSWEFVAKSRLAKNPLEKEKQRENVDRQRSLFYFADVCAGPGGFSEYMLWRKGYYNSKGFGFTLTGRDDFKLERFEAASSEYFEPYYGIKEDGNVTDPENLESLNQFLNERIHSTEKGVHLVMCDGGFSVQGQENIQEILSKRLYLCQFITGLSLCRVGIKTETEKTQGGNFLCKLFDIFTPFSMGLIYLMYVSFDKISIHKPITSRPGNSERYIFCENLNNFGNTKIKDYLIKINNKLEGFDKEVEDILELVPNELICGDDTFINYMRNSCEEIARRQIFYLRKYRKYASEPGVIDGDQEKLREEALKYWELPDFIERPRIQFRKNGKFVKDQHSNQNKREPASVTIRRFAGNQLQFPIKRRLAPFTPNEPRVCPDINELRALLLTESDDPILLVSQGQTSDSNGLFCQRLNAFNVTNAEIFYCTIPKDTILLVQITKIYQFDSEQIKSTNSCIWVLDGAVLNGDDISQLNLQDRLKATKKFCEAINKRYFRGIDKQQKRNWERSFVKPSVNKFPELIVADAINLNELSQKHFEIKDIKGKSALFPVWAADDQRDLPPKNYYLSCRGVRIQNMLNPNFMLKSRTDKNGQKLEFPIPRVTNQSFNQNPYSTFYDSLIGFIPNEFWIQTFPMGHPHNGAITFRWSWETDFNVGFGVENIIKDNEHKGGLTLNHLKKIINERQQTKQELIL